MDANLRSAESTFHRRIYAIRIWLEQRPALAPILSQGSGYVGGRLARHDVGASALAGDSADAGAPAIETEIMPTTIEAGAGTKSIRGASYDYGGLLTLEGAGGNTYPSVGDIYSKWISKCGEVGSLSPWRLALVTTKESTYPGGSKERVRRAGNNVRTGTATPDDYAVIDLWRAAHRPVLNTFQAILRTRTRGTKIVVAQRHKRKRTIFNKLIRFSSMQLHRMDDVAGCRLIFNNIHELYTFRSKLHKARFNHVLKNNIDKYDYIKSPNPGTGYKRVHDVYEYDVNSASGGPYKGLFTVSDKIPARVGDVR
jgi:hypothetical protein